MHADGILTEGWDNVGDRGGGTSRGPPTVPGHVGVPLVAEGMQKYIPNCCARLKELLHGQPSLGRCPYYMAFAVQLVVCVALGKRMIYKMLCAPIGEGQQSQVGAMCRAHGGMVATSRLSLPICLCNLHAKLANPVMFCSFPQSF